MKNAINWAGRLCLALGLIPVILLLVGVLGIAVASIQTWLGFDPTWFDIKSNLWFQMMVLAASGDPKILVSFVGVFIGLALLLLADNMQSTSPPKPNVRRRPF